MLWYGFSCPFQSIIHHFNWIVVYLFLLCMSFIRYTSSILSIECKNINFDSEQDLTALTPILCSHFIHGHFIWSSLKCCSIWQCNRFDHNLIWSWNEIFVQKIEIDRYRERNAPKSKQIRKYFMQKCNLIHTIYETYKIYLTSIKIRPTNAMIWYAN